MMQFDAQSFRLEKETGDGHCQVYCLFAGLLKNDVHPFGDMSNYKLQFLKGMREKYHGKYNAKYKSIIEAWRLHLAHSIRKEIAENIITDKKRNNQIFAFKVVYFYLFYSC